MFYLAWLKKGLIDEHFKEKLWEVMSAKDIEELETFDGKIVYRLRVWNFEQLNKIKDKIGQIAVLERQVNE